MSKHNRQRQAEQEAARGCHHLAACNEDLIRKKFWKAARNRPDDYLVVIADVQDRVGRQVALAAGLTEEKIGQAILYFAAEGCSPTLSFVTPIKSVREAIPGALIERLYDFIQEVVKFSDRIPVLSIASGGAQVLGVPKEAA